MIEINYDNSIPEIRKAYTLFRKKYAFRRMALLTLAFTVAFAFGVNFIVVDPKAFNGYILVALSLGMIASIWGRPYMAQKKLVRVIEGMGEEKYTARFLNDKIEIDTVVVPDAETEIVAITKHGVQVVENPEALAEAEEALASEAAEAPSETSVINLGTEELYSLEDEESFYLFVNRALIYIFPKRCMETAQISELSKYFEEKSI